MKTKILLLSILLFAFSCKSQINTYSEETLKKQNEKITNFQQQKRMFKTTKITVGDILSKLDVPIISFGFETETWESNNVNVIQLYFYTAKEFKYKMDNKIKFHDIYIYIKNPLPLQDVFLLKKKSQGKWTKEANDYFKDMEVESVKAN